MDDEDSISCKVVLIGESGVGKTCIISRYCANSYDENSISTTGASYAGKTVTYPNDQTIRFEIWDTAGQEKYRALTKIFYKDAAVALLIYDISREESFNELKSYWISQVKEFAQENIILGVAGNKCDLIDKEVVSEDEGRKFAEEIGAVFKLTSAFNNSGIDELFYAIGQKFIDPNSEVKGKENEDVKINLNKGKKKKKLKCCKNQ